MTYLLLTLLCGIPFANFIFRDLDIWHAQGLFFQVGVLICFCASFYFIPQKRQVRNLPFALLTLWIGSLAIWDFYRWYTDGKVNPNHLFTFLNFLCLVIFYRICVQYLNRDGIRKILKGLSAVLLITLFYCVIQAFELDQFHKKVEEVYLSHLGVPVVGFIGNPTLLSAYLGMCLPILFIRRRITSSLSVILLFIIICAFTGYASHTIPVTGIGVAIATLLYYSFRKHRTIFWVLLALVMVGVVGVLKYSEKEFLSSSGRTGQWKLYLNYLKENPFFGKGLGFMNTIASKLDHRVKFRQLHNDYLQVLLETGIMGLVATLYCVWEALRARVKCDEGIILKAVFIGFLLFAMTLFPAHLWLTASVGMFAYASLYILKEN